MKNTENWGVGGGVDMFDLAGHAGVDVQPPKITPFILVVDDNDLVLDMLSTLLSERQYNFRTARALREAEEILSRDRFNILILDIRLSDGDIFRLLDNHPRLSDEAVVILMSGADELDYAVQALRRGVQDFIVKPFSIPTFDERLRAAIDRWQARFRTQFYQAQLENLVKTINHKLLMSDRLIDTAYDETVRALGAAINLRDPETEEHCHRVSRNSLVLARMIGYPRELMKQLEWGSYLHDIGKIGVPESILTKQGPLTQAEMNMIRLHPVLGNRMLSNIEFLRGSCDVVLYHHERYDGTGYPHGLTGSQIPFSARIFSVIDMMDAILHERPYREASPYGVFLEELERGAGGQFDPEVASVVLEVPASVWRQAEDG